METPSFSKKPTPRQAVPVPLAVRKSTHGLWDRSAAAGIPATPLLGALPLRRWIPQDIHSLLDYQASLRVMVAGLLAGPGKARTVGVLLGASGLGLSLLTDYRLSFKKLIPIEVHEAVGDYLWSFGVIAAPFVFGYARRHRWVTLTHAVVGVGNILGALVTDYRAQRGVQWNKGRVTDLGGVGA